LAWEKGNNVRFIIKDYSSMEDPITDFDRLIPKDLFYSEFQNLIKKMIYYANKHKDVCRQFQKQEKLLNSLKWQYDEDLPYIPWEYSIIKRNVGKTEELEKFADMLYKSAEPTVIYDEEPYECFTCKLIGNYYYGISEKEEGLCINRTYFYSHILKDIIRFMQSKDFNYKKGMSLTEIHDQLLAKGYYKVIDCKYKNKKVFIYANGQVESKEATKEEQTELEQIIKQITKTLKDKNNLMVSEFVELLRTNIDCISYRDNKMKL